MFLHCGASVPGLNISKLKRNSSKRLQPATLCLAPCWENICKCTLHDVISCAFHFAKGKLGQISSSAYGRIGLKGFAAAVFDGSNGDADGEKCRRTKRAILDTDTRAEEVLGQIKPRRLSVTFAFSPSVICSPLNLIKKESRLEPSHRAALDGFASWSLQNALGDFTSRCPEQAHSSLSHVCC